MSTVAMAQRVKKLDRLYLKWDAEMRAGPMPPNQERAIRIQKARDAYEALVAAYRPDPGVDDVLAAVDRDVALASGETKELAG